MRDYKWGEIEEKIDKILDMPENRRIPYLEKTCTDRALKSEILEILQCITDSEGWFENLRNYRRSIFNESFESDPSFYIDNLIGTQFGSYTITKKIGEGGMGVVFLAERTDGSFKHQVAIKIIRNSKATKQNIRRFKREQQILARLNHPGIAQLFDGGITKEGFPYIIMEYVDGTPITKYCEKYTCTVSQKIHLIKQVLKAVQNAHENLTVHSDLKPDNILIDGSGNVKVLDFGISKLLEDDDNLMLTKTGSKILTPRYAAPEQIKGERITTATDMYSLGVVFYKLLTNTDPYRLDDKTHYQIEQTIIHEEALKPSDMVADPYLKRALKGDLDAILLKSVRKETEARYRYANEFLNDLIKYEHGLPVSAQKDSFFYRNRKYLNRNKKGLTVAAVFIITLITGTIFYTTRIAEEKRQAQFEANRTEQISDFLINLLEASDPSNNLGYTFTTKDLLENSHAQITKINNQPVMQARLLDITGQVYRNIGLYEQAKENIETAINIRKNELGENHPQTLSSMHNLGLVLNDIGKFEEAASTFQQVYKTRKELYGENNIDVASTKSFWAFSIRKQGNYELAERMSRESLAIFREQLGTNHIQTLDVLNKLALTLHNKGNYAEAEQYYKEVLNSRKSILDEIHPEVAKSYNNLASLYLNTGRFSEALQMMESALYIHKKLYGEFHPDIALVTNNIGLVQTELGNYSIADSLINRSIEMRNELLGENHVNTAISYFSLAKLKLKVKQPVEAVQLFEKAKRIFISELNPKHSFTAQADFGIGRAEAQLGNKIKAEQYMNQGFEQIVQIHPVLSIERAMAEYYLGLYHVEETNVTAGLSLIESAAQKVFKIEGKNGDRYKKISGTISTLTS